MWMMLMMMMCGGERGTREDKPHERMDGAITVSPSEIRMYCIVPRKPTQREKKTTRPASMKKY
eukprot:gene12520-8575_t